MSKQESVSDWMGLAKAFDKAEKEANGRMAALDCSTLHEWKS